MGQIIAVTGMGGCGKTTFAANLACSLAEREKVVAILSAEVNFGTIQTFFGESIENSKGIMASFTDKAEQPERMLTQCGKVHDNIYVMAIPNENYEIHIPELNKTEKEKIEQIIRRLSIISDYLIVDCTSDLYNPISMLGINKAHFVCCAYKITSNAVLWHHGIMPTIMQLTSGHIYSIISEHQKGCRPDDFLKTVNMEDIVSLPNIDNMPIFENIGIPLYFSNEKDKAKILYRKALCDIADNIIRKSMEVENAGK